MSMKPGLYETVMTPAVRAAVEGSGLRDHVSTLPEDTAEELLARHLYQAARRSLGSVPGEGRRRLDRQLAIVTQALDALHRETPKAVLPGDSPDGALLRALTGTGPAGAPLAAPRSPGVPLRHSDLIFNGPRDLRVGQEVVRELASVDRVDLLMSFVKWSGFIELREALLAARDRGVEVRLITTTYMGATEVRALDALAGMGAAVKVSYDERRTRLHAKTWLFHRSSGFSTALVGSSNLSAAALRDGNEWNVRLSRVETPALLAKLATTFDQYWEDPAFEDYDGARFREVLAAQARATAGDYEALLHAVQLRPFPHQQAVLDALAAERRAGHWRNLVVAATGTGKTVMAALDYARLPGRPSLLFVAHRREILEQSRRIFQLALQDADFGELWGGGQRPQRWRHLFASVQSLSARGAQSLDPQGWDVLIVDEFHHAAAATYTALLERLRPELLLGLTATPERTDGHPILHWFDDRIAAESRLWDALAPISSHSPARHFRGLKHTTAHALPRQDLDPRSTVYSVDVRRRRPTPSVGSPAAGGRREETQAATGGLRAMFP